MAQTEPEAESQSKEKVVPVAVTDSDDQPGDQPSGLPLVVGMENITLSGTDLDFEFVGNKLILKGNPKDLDIIEALISVVEESRETKEIRLETLEQRDANEVARTIESALREVFFEPNQRPEDQISIIALSSTLLLVSALPNQIDVVIDVIRKADEADETLGKVEQLIFQIKHRKATEVAEELKEIIGKLRTSKGDQGAEDKFQIIPNVANNTITAPNTRANVLSNRKPMKSGTVRESRDRVKTRSRGATTVQEKSEKPTTKGTSSSHGTPHP